MTSRNKPGVAFWATVAVVVALVAYPLSFGPACWLASWTPVDAELVPTIYRPITINLSLDHGWLDGAIRWYARIGAADGFDWWPYLDDSGGVRGWLWARM